MTARWAAAAGVVLAIALTSCSASDNGGAVGGAGGAVAAVPAAGALRDRLPEAVQAAGVLRVAVAADRPPLMFGTPDGADVRGIEAELVQAIAGRLGVTVRYVEEPRGALVDALGSGTADVLISSFPDLRALEQQGTDFVDYLTGRTAVLVAGTARSPASGPDDLCGRPVAVELATAEQVTAGRLAAACGSRGRPGPALQVVASQPDLLAALASGRVAAALTDAVVADYTAQASSGAASVQVRGAAVDPVPYGIGVARSAPQLRDAVRAALQAVIADGEYDRALERWGGELAALRTATVDGGI